MKIAQTHENVERFLKFLHKISTAEALRYFVFPRAGEQEEKS